MKTDQRRGTNKTAKATLNTHTAFKESAPRYVTTYVPYSLCYIFILFFALGGNKCHTEQFVDFALLYPGCVFLI